VKGLRLLRSRAGASSLATGIVLHFIYVEGCYECSLHH
jgi:hypothetical protein